MSNFDPDVSLRTLRAIVANSDASRDSELTETAHLAIMIGTFDALDVHLAAGGTLPTAWRDHGKTDGQEN